MTILYQFDSEEEPFEIVNEFVQFLRTIGQDLRSTNEKWYRQFVGQGFSKQCIESTLIEGISLRDRIGVDVVALAFVSKLK
jgi:hypothetical protein